MKLIKIDDLKPWYETECPECNRYMSFLQYGELAMCSHAGCGATFIVESDAESNWEPVLTKRRKRYG